MSIVSISERNSDFYLNNNKIILYGYGIDSWLDLEHFMISIPGTDSRIRITILNAYGKDNATKFWTTTYKSIINEDDFKFLKGLELTRSDYLSIIDSLKMIRNRVHIWNKDLLTPL
jgi:hypothetical protein